MRLIKPLLAIIMGVIFLTGCNDEGFLAHSNDNQLPPQLTAFPQVFIIDHRQSQTVDINQSVTAVHSTDWQLTQVESLRQLGNINLLQQNYFNYSAQQTGVDLLKYQVATDDTSATNSVVMAINQPSADNHAPTAQDIIIRTDSHTPVTIDFTDYIDDIDDSELNIIEFLSASADFKLQDKQLTFTPNGFTGVAKAVYAVSDPQASLALAYVLVITNEQQPLLSATDYSKNLDVASTPVWQLDLKQLGLISSTSASSITLTHLYDRNQRAQIISPHAIEYTPKNFLGIDQITYQIEDQQGNSAIATITLTVTDSRLQNHAPQASPISLTMLDNEQLNYNITEHISDEDDDELTLVNVINATGQVDLNAITPLSFTYQPSQVGIDQFEYMITDGQGGVAQSSISIDVKSHNPNPPATTIVQTNMMVNQSVSIDLNDYITDIETSNEQLIISDLNGVQTPAVATLNDKILTYHSRQFYGVNNLTYRVSDGLHSSVGHIVITVNPNADHNIIANDIHLEIPVASSTSINLLDYVDTQVANALPLTVTEVSGQSKGNIHLVDNQLTYTANVGAYGNDQLVYKITDSHTPTHVAQGIINLNIQRNTPPQLTSLAIAGDPVQNQPLQSQVECQGCLPDLYQYRWIINGLVASTASQYTLQAADRGHPIKLEVIADDGYQQHAQGYQILTPYMVDTIFTNHATFSALTYQGKLITWGHQDYGGDSSAVADKLQQAVKHVIPGQRAVAAIKEDGSALAWGVARQGGDTGSADLSSNVSQITAARVAFAALKTDGSVLTWGRGSSHNNNPALSTGVKKVFTNEFAFAALKEDGSVITWGLAGNGGDSSAVSQAISANVRTIYSAAYAFAALKDDGSVVTWGSPTKGGDSSTVTHLLQSGVINIVANEYAFVALKQDGSIVTWGDTTYGGQTTAGDPTTITAAKAIYAAHFAFAALTETGQVIAWGVINEGGDASAVAAHLNSNVVSVHAAPTSFHALKTDNSLISWGNSNSGGDNQIRHNVGSVYSGFNSVAALKLDGSLTVWGNPLLGADTTNVANQLNADISQVYATDYAFAVIKHNGEVVIWGHEWGGGDAQTVMPLLVPSYKVTETVINH